MAADLRDNIIAWQFHQNTVRWPHNMLDLPTEPAIEPPFKEYFGAHVIPLPVPEAPKASLGDAIARRLSCRNFSPSPLPLVALSSILKAGYGINGVVYFGADEHHERPVPSGGGLYPLELYVAARNVPSLAEGIYHYTPLSHSLEQIRRLPLPGALLAQLFMGQPYLASAAAILVMAGVFARTMKKYADRGYRYMLIEAGHVGQNINLTALSLGLGSFNMGGFFDAYLCDLLGLQIEQEAPLYAVALGVPASDDRPSQRLVQDL